MVTLRNSHLGVTIEQLKEFERIYRLELPEDYKIFLLSNNGGTPDQVYYTENNAAVVVNFFLSLGTAEYSLEQYIEDWRADGLTKDLVPIGEDAFGNLICIGCSDGNRGPLYFFNHETAEIRFIAPSVSHLLSHLKTELE